MADPSISVVIPVHNEEKHILPLYDRLVRVLDSEHASFEVIFVDDCSSDSSRELLTHLVDHDDRLRAVFLRRNFGQTAALAAGFEYAEGEVIIAMDGDLQHAPEDLPAFLARIGEGYDIVSGWRERRVDNWLTRRLPSRIANWLMAKVSGVALHDFGTTFKAYRRDTIKSVRLYGDLHRFIPALAHINGARIAEVPIRNVPRANGQSHYGLGRSFRVLFDILTIRFLVRYFTRPMHFFGALGLAFGSLGGLAYCFLLVQKLRGIHVMDEHGPLMIAGAVFLLAGIQMFCTGLIGEVLIRTYFESQDRPIYAVRQVLRKDRESKVAD